MWSLHVLQCKTRAPNVAPISLDTSHFYFPIDYLPQNAGLKSYYLMLIGLYGAHRVIRTISDSAEHGEYKKPGTKLRPLHISIMCPTI